MRAGVRSGIQNSYGSDAGAYWGAWDAMLADAHAAGCAVMPSLFWNAFAFAGRSCGVASLEMN